MRSASLELETQRRGAGEGEGQFRLRPMRQGFLVSVSFRIEVLVLESRLFPDQG